MPGANVVIVNEDTGISRTVKADAAGHYFVPGLGLGNYRVTGSKEGFQTEVRGGLVLTVAREEVVDLSLAVGSATETVEVNGQAPLVDTSDASLGALVDDRTIRSLPLNGRSYDQLAVIQPGVIHADPGIPNIPLQYGSGERFTVGGQRPTSNLFLLDGTDINDHSNSTPGGASGSLLGVDTILEFKIFTNWFNAEYGHSSGSVVSSVTRSGTNAIHGTAFEYVRNSAMDARNYFDTAGLPPPPFSRNQFGGVIGGPIKKDKAFFFAGYEGLRQILATTLTATTPDAAARQGSLPNGSGGTTTVTVSPNIVPYLNAFYPLPNGRDYGDGTGAYTSAPPAPTQDDNFMGRVDYQVNSKLSLFARYVYDQDSANAPQPLPTQLTVTADKRQYTTIQANAMLSPKAFNNVRFSYNRSAATIDTMTVGVSNVSALAFIPGQDIGAIAVGSLNAGSTNHALTTLGNSSGNGNYVYAFGNYETADDFSYVKGKHTLKTGFNIERIEDNFSNPSSTRGYYVFKTLNTFLTATPSTFQTTVPVGVSAYWGMRQTLMGAYVQDDYKANSRLTVNLGLRWEAVTDPYDVNGKTAQLPTLLSPATVISSNVFNVGKANFEPRIGLAFQLNSSGKTVLHAGAGTYYNQMLPVTYYNYCRLQPFYTTEQATNPPFPNGLQAALATGIPALVAMAPNQKTPVDYQYNLSLQQQLSKALVLEAYYAGSKSAHTPVSPPSNTYIPLSVTNGQPVYAATGGTRPNTNFGTISYEEPIGHSTYDSGTILLREQSAKGLVGEVFYTYSKSLDLNSGTSTADSRRSPGALMNPYDYGQDWGLSDFNAKSRFGINGSYPLPFRSHSKVLGTAVNGWTLDAIGTLQTGLPFTALLASSVSNDGANTLADRPNLRAGFSNNPIHGVSAGCSGFAQGTRLGGAANYFDPCAFSAPTAGTFGNVGRNTIIGPGLVQTDIAAEKTFSFKVREPLSVTFRGEMFNVLNHTNLGLPSGSALMATGVAVGSAGTVTYTATSSRQIEFAVRIHY